MEAPLPLHLEVRRAHSPDRRPVRRRSDGAAARRMLVRRPRRRPDAHRDRAAAADLCASAAPSGSVSDGVTVTGDAGQRGDRRVRRAARDHERRAHRRRRGRRRPDRRRATSSQYGATIFDAATGELVESGGYDSAILPVQVSVGLGRGSVLRLRDRGRPHRRWRFPASDQAAALGVGARRARHVARRRVGRAAGAGGRHADRRARRQRRAHDHHPRGRRAHRGRSSRPSRRATAPSSNPGDTVLVHYTGVKWSDGTVFDSSWERGAPASFATTGVVEGFQQALEGQTVGSQVLVVDPAGVRLRRAGRDHELQDETLVFVVDILGTQSPATAQ